MNTQMLHPIKMLAAILSLSFAACSSEGAGDATAADIEASSLEGSYKVSASICSSDPTIGCDPEKYSIKHQSMPLVYQGTLSLNRDGKCTVKIDLTNGISHDFTDTDACGWTYGRRGSAVEERLVIAFRPSGGNARRTFEWNGNVTSAGDIGGKFSIKTYVQTGGSPGYPTYSDISRNNPELISIWSGTKL
jgi:hypothetical protein